MLSFLLIIIGSLVNIVGSIWLIIKAFKTHIAWGVTSLLIPGALIVYCIKHWEQTKRPFFISHGALVVAFVGIYQFFSTGMSSSSLAMDDTDNATQASPVLSAKLEQLPDTAPEAGGCIGWQNSLAIGKTDKITSVEDCFRKLALSNRDEAAKQADVLKTWKIDSEKGDSLIVLVNTLSAFKSDTELANFLNSLGLIKEKSDPIEDIGDPAMTVNSFLEKKGNTHWFDVETGFFPNEHDDLLRRLAALSSGMKGVTFEEIAPEEDSEESPYLLIAKKGDKRYEQQAENMGDWYDVEAVLALLNKISVDLNSSDRYLTLPTGDQTAVVLAISQNTLQTLIQRQLLLVEDASAAMEAGKQFEAQVGNEIQTLHR